MIAGRGLSIRGKSGLHKAMVPGNARLGKPKGKRHREQTAMLRHGQGNGGVRAHRGTGNRTGTASPTRSNAE